MKNYVTVLLQICVKERDLLAGTMEHSAMLTLIAERCKTVIAIMSEAFLKTHQNKFFLSYAQSVGIGECLVCVNNKTYCHGRGT